MKKSRFIRCTRLYAGSVSWCNSKKFESPDAIFSDYVYFSSYSDSWLAHARKFAGNATRRFGLDFGLTSH